MKKYLIIGIACTVALVAVAKTTNLSSYAATLFKQVQKDVDTQIPTKFEIERIRHEIANLDGDISGMIRPIAEYKAEIVRTRKEVAANQTTIEEKKQKLLAFVPKMEGNSKFVRCDGRDVPMERFKAEFQRQTDGLKSMEKNLKTQQQVLEAKEKSLKATQDQLEKVVSKKREYEGRLAELEALAQSVQCQLIASDIKIDSSRATQIEDALRKLETKLEADRHEVEMRQGASGNLNLFEREPEPFDLQAAVDFLKGNEAPGKVANNK
jgi:peptidoglycan hydrolase CwlO-like protein